jgi:N-formylglutamate deformylase
VLRLGVACIEAHCPRSYLDANRDHSAAHPALVTRVAAFLRARSQSVEINYPDNGVELVRRYANPVAHRHSLQREIKRRLYLDEQTLPIGPGFDALQFTLRALVEGLLALDPRSWNRDGRSA